jgi:hypothetical protein
LLAVTSFAAGLTRPDGTSARVPRQLDPVETTHPHWAEPLFGARILAPPVAGVERPGRGRRRIASMFHPAITTAIVFLSRLLLASGLVALVAAFLRRR